jgi:hypothetical protein
MVHILKGKFIYQFASFYLDQQGIPIQQLLWVTILNGFGELPSAAALL